VTARSIEATIVLGGYKVLKITVISCFFAARAVEIASEPLLIGKPATPDELIADQVTIAPCWTPVEFTSFRYPYV